MSTIQIIPLEDHLDSQREGMVRVSVTLPRADLQKLHDFMSGDAWEKAEAARKARLDDCLKSLEIAVKFDVSDLKLLDRANFEHAMNSIRLCQETNREPHQFFTDGGELFEQMIRDWKLEKKRRAA